MAWPNSATRALYDRIMGEPSSQHFRVLPDPILYADYYRIVKKPLALADMNRAMSLGRYTLESMTRDMRRMLANARRYNKPEAVAFQDAVELEVRRATGSGRARARAPPLTHPPPPRSLGAPQRVFRRHLKEIEREGPEDEDEDTTYAKSNKDRL